MTNAHTRLTGYSGKTRYSAFLPGMEMEMEMEILQIFIFTYIVQNFLLTMKPVYITNLFVLGCIISYKRLSVLNNTPACDTNACFGCALQRLTHVIHYASVRSARNHPRTRCLCNLKCEIDDW